MPTPYQSLIEAAARLEESDLAVEDPKQLGEAELAAILKPNWQAMEEARGILHAKPRVTIRYDVAYMEECRETWQPFRVLCRQLSTASLLATRRGDFAEAARLGLDILELSHTVRSAGLTVDYLIAEAFAGVGTDSLRIIRDRLDESTRRMVIDRLIQWQADLWPAEEILAHDDHWMEVSGYVDPPDNFDEFDDGELSEEEKAEMDKIFKEMAERPPEVLNQMHLNVETRTLAMVRMLIVDLALRSYREAEGHYPEKLTELEPILPAGIPLDPYTGRAFTYRRQQDDSFQLYSPGPTGVDHGGTFGFGPDIDAGLVDVCLDAADYADWL